jgi:hypothetical protein
LRIDGHMKAGKKKPIESTKKIIGQDMAAFQPGTRFRRRKISPNVIKITATIKVPRSAILILSLLVLHLYYPSRLYVLVSTYDYIVYFSPAASRGEGTYKYG